MDYKLETLVDIGLMQSLQDKLNLVYSFPSAIIDNEGKVLTAVAWQDICTKFHRTNPECEKECIKSDQYILEHISEANPAVSYQCPLGLIDNATPIIIEGQHYGNFFTGQFFLEKPDLDFFKKQAKKYGFDEKAYLAAVEEVPIWTKEKLTQYLDFIKGFIEIIASIGLKSLQEIETRKIIIESEKLFQSVVENSSDLIVLTGEKGIVTYVSTQCEQVLGYPASKIIGLIIPDFIHPDDKIRCQHEWEQAFQHGKDIREYEYRIIDGENMERWISHSAKMVKANEKVIGLQNTIRNITDQKRAEITLRESNQFNSQIVNSVHEGIIVYDLDLKYRVWNPYMENLTGLSASEVIGKHPLDLFPFLKDAGVIGIIEKALIGEHNKGVDFPFGNLPNGKSGWSSDTTAPLYNSKNEIIGAISCVRDITERKQADKALMESEERFQLLFNKAPLGYQSLDINGNFIDLNQQWLDTLGYSRDEVIGKWFGDFLSPAYQDGFRKRFPIFIAQGHIHSEFEMVHKNGNKLFVAFEGKIGYEKNGEFKQTHCILQDITEVKKSQEETIRQKELLQRIIDHVPVMITYFDKNGKILLTNNELVKVLGWTRNEWETENIFAKCYPEPEYAKEVLDFMNSGKSGWKDLRTNTKYGTVIDTSWTNIMLSEGFSMGIGQDITDRKHAQAVLKEAKETAEQYLNISAELIFTLDTQGNIKMMNESGHRLLGYKAGELIGKNWFDTCFPKEIRSEIYAVFQKLMNGDIASIATYENAVITKNRDLRMLLWHNTLLRDKNEKIIGLLSSAQDITERKQAEEKIREKDIQFRKLSANVPDLIFQFTRRPNGTYCVPIASEGIRNIFGCSPEDVVDDFTPIGRVIYPEDAARVISDIEYSAEHLTYFTCEFRVQIAGKEIQWILSRSSPEKLPDGSITWYGFNADITERKAFEEELIKAKLIAEENEIQLKAILENSSTGFAINKISTTEVTYVNQAFADAYHIPLKLCSNVSTFFEYVYGNQMELGKKILNDLNSGIPERLVWDKVPIIDKETNTTHYVLASNIILEELDLMISSVRDITAQVENEEKLIRSDRVFNLTLDMFCIAGFDGYFKYLNPAWERILGWSIEELLSKPWLDFVHPDDAENTENVKSVIVDGKEIYKFENRYISKDGSIKWLSWNSQPFPEENIMIGAVRDVTETKNIEKELINAKEKAEESDRLKSAFLANMSHEIRTPMNGILGFTELLKEPDLTGDEQNKYIDLIEKGGERLLNIINDLINISKVESGQMKVSISESNINDQFKYVYSFFKPEAERKEVKLIYKNSLPFEQAYIQTDPEKVYAILSNLVKNAIKYTDEGSIEFGYEKKGEYIEFYVKDSGIGIPKNRQEAIFERFVQADINDKMAKQGAGLGLSISKAYVELLGGKIWVESDPDSPSIEKGSTFYFTLPYITSVKKEIAIENIAAIDTIPNLKILIAEDDKISETLLTIGVEKFSREIIKVTTGVKAVEACRNNPDIDLVLMDIRMPEMDGYEATRQIRQFNKEVIIIAQTAYGLSGDREKAISAGCNEYLSKPLTKSDLLALIQKYFKK